jgi:hypothetical protein
MTHKTRLAAKVAARNEANTLALSLYTPAVEALKPFIGQKIIKAVGTLLEKVKAKLPPLPDGRGGFPLGWYSVGNGYSLTLHIKCCHDTPSGHANCCIAAYMEAVVYLGEITDGNLRRIYDPPKLRVDYSEDEVIHLRRDIREKREILRSAESLLGVGEFGEHDA